MPTILLVDDEPESLAALSMVLELRGYQVHQSGDGKAALEQAGRLLPDLIVTDCSMPVMDGVQLCRHLKLYPALAAIPVIMVSARAPITQEPTLWNVFFFKPINLDDFESTVRLLILSRPSRETLRPVCSTRSMSRWHRVSSAFIT
jgi:CheY-like chemotaxis protein